MAKLLHRQQIAPDIMPIDEIVEAMQIQNKTRILEKIEAKQKAMQEMQQKREQLEMQQLQVDNLTKVAYAHSQEGLAKERVARIQTDVAVAQDKIRRSQQEDTHSVLNVIKALKELQGMDLDNLMRGLEVFQALSPAPVTQSGVENKANVA